MKYNKKNFPVNARPKDYERWAKGFFTELEETPTKELVPFLAIHEDDDSDYRSGFYAGVYAILKVILGHE